MTRYNFQREENDKFQNEINRTLKFEKYVAKKKNPYNGENAKRDEVFKEIILHYRAKGLKVPELTTEKNLFKPSALLIDDAQLKSYFQIKKGEKNHKGFDEKESYFISKINNLLYKRLQEIDERADLSKLKKQDNIENFEANAYQTNLLGIGSNNNNENIVEEINLKQLRQSIDKLKTHNESMKESIMKFQENNYDFNNESEIEENEKKNCSAKKTKKPKIAYEEFISRLSKPKDKNIMKLNEIKIKKNPESKIINAIENMIGKNNPYKPIMKSTDGKIFKAGDGSSQYLNNIKQNLRKTGDFPGKFGTTLSMDFTKTTVKIILNIF